jgi:hypothetical protein
MVSLISGENKKMKTTTTILEAMEDSLQSLLIEIETPSSGESQVVRNLRAAIQKLQSEYPWAANAWI